VTLSRRKVRRIKAESRAYNMSTIGVPNYSNRVFTPNYHNVPKSYSVPRSALPKGVRFKDSIGAAAKSFKASKAATGIKIAGTTAAFGLAGYGAGKAIESGIARRKASRVRKTARAQPAKFKRTTKTRTRTGRGSRPPQLTTAQRKAIANRRKRDNRGKFR
jgi:hypothetical protein